MTNLFLHGYTFLHGTTKEQGPETCSVLTLCSMVQPCISSVVSTFRSWFHRGFMWSFDWLCHNVLKITGSFRRKKVSWYWLVELVFGVVISRPTTTMMDGGEGEGMVIGAGGGLVTALNVDVYHMTEPK